MKICIWSNSSTNDRGKFEMPIRCVETGCKGWVKKPEDCAFKSFLPLPPEMLVRDNIKNLPVIE